MNLLKEYFLPTLVILLVAAMLIFGTQFLAQASWAEGVRETARNTPPEVGDAPATLVEFLTAFAISTVKTTFLIGIPFALASAVLKRTQRSPIK